MCCTPSLGLLHACLSFPLYAAVKRGVGASLCAAACGAGTESMHSGKPCVIDRRLLRLSLHVAEYGLFALSQCVVVAPMLLQ